MHGCAGHGQLFLLRGVKVKKAQRAGVGAVFYRYHQLPAWAKGYFARSHFTFNLRVVTIARVAQLGDVRLIFIPQRYVQRQVNVAHQAQLVQRFLRGRFGRLDGKLRGGRW